MTMASRCPKDGANLYDPSASLYLEKEAEFGYVVFNRTDKKNAVSMDMWRRLPDCVKALDQDADVKVIILKSAAAGVFCAGADIAEFTAIAKDEALCEEQRLAIRVGQRSLARCHKPTIAMIDGPCVGAGCGISLHCDFRYASERATFGITPAKLGLVYPLNDTKHLVDLVGPSFAKEILFSARLFSAEEALKMGLVNHIFTSEQLEVEVANFASKLASVSQYALVGIKKTIQCILDGQVDDDFVTSKWFTDAYQAPDHKEGVQAFLEKRKPDFTWAYGPEEHD